jgi:hypothetical protein
MNKLMDKQKIFKIIHRFILSCIFLFFNWFIINKLIIDVSFIRYCFIEALILLSMKLYLVTVYKTGL